MGSVIRSWDTLSNGMDHCPRILSHPFTCDRPLHSLVHLRREQWLGVLVNSSECHFQQSYQKLQKEHAEVTCMGRMGRNHGRPGLCIASTIAVPLSAQLDFNTLKSCLSSCVNRKTKIDRSSLSLCAGSSRLQASPLHQ